MTLNLVSHHSHVRLDVLVVSIVGRVRVLTRFSLTV